MDKNKEKLHQIITEAIKQVLEENKKGVLNEMALPRKNYKEKIDGLMPQILENWCLVHYCTLTDRSNYKIHWTDELRGHILTASRFSIKGNDSSEARLKVLSEVIDENDYTDPQFLNLTIVNKFIKEKIDTSSETYGQVLEECITSIQSICDAILSRDKDQITTYVRNI